MTTVRSLNSGPAKLIGDDAIKALDVARGAVYVDGSPDMRKGRRIWKYMVDRKPGMVIRARGASDVMNAVNFARENGLLMSSSLGWPPDRRTFDPADGAIMLDLSHTRSVHIDPRTKIARIEPGALLSDIDREHRPTRLRCRSASIP